MYREKEAPSIEEELSRHPVVRIVEDLDCFVPRMTVTLKYSGPNVREITRKAMDILQRAMRIGGTDVYQDDYYIDVTDPNNIRFHIFSHGDKGFDMRTRMWCYVKLKNGLLKPDGSGSVDIEIIPKLVTQWDKSSLIKRNPLYGLLIKIYKYVYYDEQRRKYLRWCKDLANEAVGTMKELLKMMKTAEYP